MAWARLAEVTRWPEWAPHLTAVTVAPGSPLGPSSSGALHLRWLGRTTFRMSAWEPPHRWVWVGRLPGVRIEYDHRFAPAGTGRTRQTWVVDLRGPLAPLVRPAFGPIYTRNLDRAIPRLQGRILTPEPESGSRHHLRQEPR